MPQPGPLSHFSLVVDRVHAPLTVHGTIARVLPVSGLTTMIRLLLSSDVTRSKTMRLPFGV